MATRTHTTTHKKSVSPSNHDHGKIQLANYEQAVLMITAISMVVGILYAWTMFFLAAFFALMAIVDFTVVTRGVSSKPAKWLIVILSLLGAILALYWSWVGFTSTASI